MTDLEIAQQAVIKPIKHVALAAGLKSKQISLYGNYKAKVDYRAVLKKRNKIGKLILVTAINPTSAGEGKTTTTIGLADAMRRLGKSVVVALREPSLGPVFGLKGGATGGGYAQVLPMEDINLHFTGDFHAITTANNLLCAMADNHIFQGNTLGLDPEKITFKRCLDLNDRQLRYIKSGLGGAKSGVERNDGFDITAASEVMATLCLASDFADLKKRLGDIVVGYTFDDRPVTARDLKADGAMAALLKDAINPNLVQSLEGTPAFVHGGPFANIAHGCNSVIATKCALKLADYAVTEAGFGADLGAEKFLDIKCRKAGFKPSAVVIVATIRALKLHGGADKTKLSEEDLTALEKGIPHILRHVKTIKETFGIPCVVAVNNFPTDKPAEISTLLTKLDEAGVKAILSTVFAEGGKGGLALAKKVVELCEKKNSFKFVYDEKDSIEDKINAIVTKVYGGDGVDFTDEAKAQIARLNALGYGKTPVCIAKTQYSFTDDPTIMGAPKGFRITVREVKVSAGAGFVVALTGKIMTMPGLGKTPAAESITVSDDGTTKGLF
jgi:formate--tetrahydrofolate ligase